MPHETPPRRLLDSGTITATITRSVAAASALAAAVLISSIPSDADAQSFSFEDIDAIGSIGANASIAIDAAGNPHITYYDADTHQARYAHRVGGTWRFETPGVGTPPLSLALDPQDRPAFTFALDETLRLAHRLESGWVFENVDDVAVGGPGDLDFDSNGDPHIAYNRTLPPNPPINYGYRYIFKYAHRVNGVWSIETVDSGSDASGISMALDWLNSPHVTCSEGGLGRVVYWRKFVSWRKEIVDDPPFDYATSGSIALDPSGRPAVIYRYLYSSRYVRYARRVGEGAWNFEDVNPGHDALGYMDMAFDSHAIPHISFEAGDRDLWYATRPQDAWFAESIATAGDQGQFNSIAIDADDRVYIVYQDVTRAELVLATSTFTADVPAARGGSLRFDAPQPNPSRPGAAAFSFRLARAGLVSLDLFGLRGERLASRAPEWRPAGSAVVRWDPAIRSPGVYFVRLRTEAGETAWTKWVMLR